MHVRPRLRGVSRRYGHDQVVLAAVQPQVHQGLITGQFNAQDVRTRVAAGVSAVRQYLYVLGPHAYLLGKLTITQAKQVRALNTTHIPMTRGFAHLTAVVDVAIRKVLAQRAPIALEAINAKEVIELALASARRMTCLVVTRGLFFAHAPAARQRKPHRRALAEQTPPLPATCRADCGSPGLCGSTRVRTRYWCHSQPG